MIQAQPLLDEALRLEVLRRYSISDEPPDHALDDLSRLAAAICETPIACVALVDDQREWFLSKFGMTGSGIPREFSFCAQALASPGLFIVPDATQDARFAGNPQVIETPGICFFAGAPLLSPEGAMLGALCVIDRVPRTLTPIQEGTLGVLARQAMAQLELRHSTRKLQASEADRLAILSSSLDGIIAIDLEGRILEFNPAAERIFGYTRADVLGRLLEETIVPPDLRERHRSGLIRYQETGTTRLIGKRTEIPALRADGTQFPAELSIVRGPGTERPMFIGFIRDLTESKRAEAALRASEGKLRAIFEAEPDCVKLLGADATLHEMNAAGLQLIEASSLAPVLGQCLLPIVVPEDREAVRTMLAAVGRGERRSVQYRIVGLKGTLRWLEMNGVPFHDDSTGRDYVLGVSNDITARKQAEEKIHRLNRLYAVSSSVNEAIVRIRDTRLLYEQACRIAVERGRLVMAWVGLAEADGTELQPAARWGRDDGYLDSIKVMTTPEQREGLGPGGEAFRTGRPACCNDIEADPEFFASRAEALHRGFRSCAAFPLKQDGCTIGVLAVYGDQAGYFDTDELRLLNALAENISFAVESHCKEEQRRQAENALRASEANLAAAQAVAKIGSWETNLFTSTVTWSAETFRIFEQPIGEFQPTHERFLEGVHPDDRAAVNAAFTQSLTQCGLCLIEHRILLPDGRIKTVEERWQNFSDDDGHPVRSIGTCQDITPRKQAEDALQESEARLARATEAGRIGIWDWDMVTNQIVWSQVHEELWGMAAGSYRGTYEEFRRGVHPGDCAALEAAVQHAVTSHTEYRQQYRVVWPDGSIHWIDGRGAARYNAEGKPVRMSGVILDITDRIAAEERTRELADRLTTTIESITDAFYTTDHDWRFTYVNHEAERLLQKPRVELLGKVVWEVFPEALGTAFDREFHRALAESSPGQIEEFYPPFGKWFEVRTYPSAQGLTVYFRDVTERKLATEQIAQQAALIDQARDAIVVRDLAHRILFWSKGAERMHGWTAAEANGRRAPELMQPNAEVFEEAAQAVLRDGEWTGEMHKVTKGKASVILDCRWTLLRDGQGQPKSILTIETDITDRKKIEQQFLRAQRMESIGTLAGGIAHDLNNVLAPIIMSLDLMKLRFPDPESLDLLGIISSSARRGADLVSQVLSFARGVSGQRLEVQIKHLVKDIEGIANETFLKHVQVRTDLPPDLWTVTGDPTQLHQVLLNLCVNARDAMPKGGRLTITAENLTLDAHYAGLNVEAKPGPYVLLQIEDSGTGIARDILEKIFDPFFTTKEIGQGTGLGLSTSQAIVKSHGGFIRVYSEEGTGTMFKVYLPAQTGTSPAVAEAIAAEMPRGDGQLVLVVDDEASVRQITRQTLEAFGYRVVVASDGAEAVATYANLGPQIAVVLTDMMMPVMDGIATIQVLRKMSPTLPIIAASGLSANGHVAHAATLGIKYFLPKPYTAETLLNVLREILAERI